MAMAIIALKARFFLAFHAALVNHPRDTPKNFPAAFPAVQAISYYSRATQLTRSAILSSRSKDHRFDTNFLRTTILQSLEFGATLGTPSSKERLIAHPRTLNSCGRRTRSWLR